MRVIDEHDRALEYDLMTRTGHTLGHYMAMGAAGKVALISFIQNLPIDSALYKELNPKDEFADWTTTLRTNAILADLYDLTSAVYSKKGHRPKPYPRPKEHRTIGHGAIPIKDFWEWWNDKE